MEMADMEASRFFDVDTTLDFGKHKGHAIEDIFDSDPDYLVWIYENFEDVDWSDEAEFLVTLAYDREYDRKKQELQSFGGY